MADLKITEKDGYEELEYVQESIKSGDLDVQALWKLIGHGDTDAAVQMLWEAGFDIDEEELEGGEIEDVRIVSTPDDVLGIFYRIWIKLENPSKAHVHDDECRSGGCRKGRTRGR